MCTYVSVDARQDREKEQAKAFAKLEKENAKLNHALSQSHKARGSLVTY